jgi:hypothetical protein
VKRFPEYTEVLIGAAIADILFKSGCKPWYSTGIHGYITVGYGHLDEFGFWEFPLPDQEFRG